MIMNSNSLGDLLKDPFICGPQIPMQPFSPQPQAQPRAPMAGMFPTQLLQEYSQPQMPISLTQTVIIRDLNIPDKHIHFSGFMHEDGNKFVREFSSYIVLAGIADQSDQAIASFHLRLQGPALVWFESLTELHKST